ncbi:hypothetical protein BO71DRAFT_402414 [Aspergillus ellipticus CBS 707.79]|uniref:rRNA methyltransferase 1, mitochondrial n=1 Tax=Aspergillus ellipticus CBS 707.79 TaxID=1448320 RepID=A0A319CZR1_9EURO|nr:hypothetical protein BO71DRAFT_402414 [Aspergillus ellipticus CBS 707.79]
MFSLYPRNAFRLPFQTPITAATRLNPVRHASLKSAIGRGIRKSEEVDKYPRGRGGNSREDRFSAKDTRKPWKSKPDFGKDEFTRSGRGSSRSHGADEFSRRGERESKPRKFEDRDSRDSRDSRRDRDFKPRKFEERDSRDSRRDRDSRPQRFEEKDTRKSWKSKSEFEEDRFNKTGSGNSSSGRDFRKSHDSEEYSPRRDRDRDSRPQRHEGRDSDRSSRRESTDGFDAEAFIKTGKFQALPREYQNPHRAPKSMMDAIREEDAPAAPRDRKAHRRTEKAPERVKANVLVPKEIPYTTPASQFVCGASAVEAALRCNRRQLYKLYIYQGVDEQLSDSKVLLRKLALSKNVEVKMAFGDWDRLLDKMSAGRPHSGCVLEASPLPQLPVTGFKAVPSAEEDYFSVELGVQSQEEAVVNGTNDRVAIHNALQKRYPVVILLDGIVDTGNLGAIIRSAYYLGIDAIVFAGRNSARLSAVSTKTAVGAEENMTLLQVRNEVSFIRQCKANGWRFYAADAPGPNPDLVDPVSLYGNGEGNPGSGSPIITDAPTVLMLGNESTGLSGHLRKQADATVSLPGARISNALGVKSDPARVDSLNVSVAAALLMNMFLRTPVSLTAKEN